MQINITVCMFQNQCVLKNIKLRKKKRDQLALNYLR